MVWATALVGVAGIIGTLLGPRWLQREVESRRRLAAFRTAKRVVFDEMQDLRQQVEALQSHGTAPAFVHLGALDTRGWIEHRNTLADALPDEAWRPCSHFFQKVGIVRGVVESTAPGAPMPPALMSLLPDVLENSFAALYRLDTTLEPVRAGYHAKAIDLDREQANQDSPS